MSIGYASLHVAQEGTNKGAKPVKGKGAQLEEREGGNDQPGQVILHSSPARSFELMSYLYQQGACGICVIASRLCISRFSCNCISQCVALCCHVLTAGVLPTMHKSQLRAMHECTLSCSQHGEAGTPMLADQCLLQHAILLCCRKAIDVFICVLRSPHL